MHHLGFKEKLEINLYTSADVMFYHDLLKEFKALGGSQKEAYFIVNDMLKNHIIDDRGEEVEDLLREILDFITGWCRKEMRVWR